MNTNTKFPPLPNPFLLQHNKHGSLPVPITIFNGNNKPPNNTVEEEDNKTDANIYEYYKDNTSDEMIYEEKPVIKNIPSTTQPIENVFDLKNYLKK
jgi:hypothetical protein